MTEAEQFSAAMELVDRALDGSPSERASLLAACPDSEVRVLAHKLLDADAAAGNFLETPMRVPAAVAGDRVGPFQLVKPIGHGGMGEVWIADRAQVDFAQRVALKLLPSASDRAMAARFRRERRILARLEHPRISKLLDGGLMVDGRPWLAMELVEGRELIAACSDLTREARLSLFAEICDVVQFAHRNLVIHRDLKPSNILVTGDGTPKLLDFGIAKLIEEDEGDGLTRTRERPMTLHYASPEQVRGDEVTIASDVWSLGVILHELLVGERPFVGTSRIETESAIVAAVPTRPSSKVDRSRARALRGDLDAIVLKALRANPAERYGSAEALGDDVRRHLARSPVVARGDATSYLVRAMIRRHRAAFAAVGIVIALLVAGIAGTLWQAHRATAQAHKAERTREFVVAILESFDPNQGQGNGTPVTQREILVRGEARLSELDDDPDDQARLLAVFASLWMTLRDYKHALVVERRAVTLERELDAHSARLGSALEDEGSIEFELADYPAAQRDFEEALAIASAREGDAGLKVASALNGLSGVHRKLAEYAQAEPQRRRALAIYMARLGPLDAATIGVENDLAVLLGDEGRLDEALELQLRACTAMRATIGQNHSETLICRANVGRDQLEMKRYATAERTFLSVIADSHATYGEDWADVPREQMLLANALDGEGRTDEAAALAEAAIARLTKLFGPDNADLAFSDDRLSEVLRHDGQLAASEAAAGRALAICEHSLPGNAACEGRARSMLGMALAAEARLDDARRELTHAVELDTRGYGAEHRETKATRAALEKIAH
jgi:eukaryotic-like serine/threonine-protein kinase